MPYTALLIDADHLDRVAFDLTVNFERIIGRRIPKADLCQWLDCIALDGGFTPSADGSPASRQVQASFLHSAGKAALECFDPSDFATQLSGRAFHDDVAEFALQAYAVEALVSADDFFIQSLEALAAADEVEALLVVADMAAYGPRVCQACSRLRAAGGKKPVTLFTMEPASGRGFEQEILGYSLMAALGIRSDELQ